MRNRRLLLAGIGILVLLLVLLSATHHSKERRSFSKITENLQNSWLNNGNVYYYTGSFFANYDTRTNSISRLSDYLFIESGISSVNWGPKAVVFQTNPASGDRDDITTAAQQLGAKQYVSHWWKYDFQTKQYELLALPGIDDCDSLTQITSQLLACVSSQSDGAGSNVLKTFDLASGSSKSLFSTDDGISSVTSDGQNVYFIVSKLDGSQSLNTASLSVKQRVLFSSKGQLTYYAYGKGRVLIDTVSDNTKVTSGENSHSELIKPVASEQKIVLMDGNKTVLAKKVKSLPLSLFAGTDGSALFSSLDGSVKRASSDGLQVLNKSASPVLSGGDFLFTSNSRLYKLTSGGELSSSPATPRRDNSKYPSSFNTVKDNDQAGNSFITAANEGQQNVYIYLSNVSSSQQELAIGTMLEQKGFKPSEFNFTWVVDGADFHAPVSPNAIILK